jgi:PleD family two-component response regulator
MGLASTARPKRKIFNMSRIGTDGSKMKQHGDNANVLIVDSEPQTIRLLLEILARKGIVARLAADRKAVLDALRGNGCDLAFLSTALAGADYTDSFQLLREIRAAAPEMPVIMMAGPCVEGVPPSTRGLEGDPKRDVSRLGTLPAFAGMT